ncbi:g10641 [Coccomyxa elongata]
MHMTNRYYIIFGRQEERGRESDGFNFCELKHGPSSSFYQGMEGSTVLERMAACLPCASWPCAGAASSRHWQLWPGDFDDDAQPILTAPTPALAECLIPPSVSNLYDDRGRSSPESSAPSWDIGAGRPPVHQMSAQRSRGGMAVSPKGQGTRAADAPDRSSAQQGGIELKQAAANPLLGQFHLQDGGRFVKAKLPSAAVGRPSSRAETGASDADKQPVKGREEGLHEGVLEDGAGAELKSSRGSSPRHFGKRKEGVDVGEQDLLGLPAA